MSQPNKAWRGFISSGGINDVIANWHSKQPPRVQTVASPSTLTECPRVVWLKKHKVAFTNDMGWGVKQRLMLGRITETLFAQQLKDEGKLLWHWKDDVVGESVKFSMGDGLSAVEGTPDLLINLDGTVLISDAKTSRADSFAYVPLNEDVWKDELWYKYKLQVEAYYLLCHKNKDWFTYTDEEKAKIDALYTPKSLKYHSGFSHARKNLPLPEACHLFSYALDDGVVKRELTWTPTKDTADKIMAYAKRWNTAYQSETMPNCKCTKTQVKFCAYASEMETTRTGYKLGIKCCANTLEDEIVKQEVLKNVAR